ncbi:MAG: DEAD/DEAH box helicase [Methylococcaceae bacterium]|nr:DEAD/DEAH box helicase [Methylococcaceae bacterium]
MPLSQFHPAVRTWFTDSFSAPTECQFQAWAAIKQGRHTLIAAPTGSGKTLAAFLSAIDDLVRTGTEFGLDDATRILYISPLKALSNDIQKNLEVPLEGINRQLFELGYGDLLISSMVRTGDTAAAARAAMTKQPPHILVTTPESVYLLLTSESGRRMLGSVQTVIVDEIHAILGSKRGSHLALSLERLDRLTGGKLHRVGLSATQNPIETVATFLTGTAVHSGRGETPSSPTQGQAINDCAIVDTGHLRRLDLAIELPDTPLEAVLSGEAAKSLYDRMTVLIREHRSTLIFVNTRRMAERLARALSDRIGEEHVTSHHGSLAKEQRLSAEHRLKQGELKAVVATASLELGIDIGDVDLVCQFGTTGSIATFLQRVGRSGHFAGGTPKGRLFPTSRDELIECLALLDAIRRGELDRIEIPTQPLDVLAQQIVAMVACEDWQEDELYALVRQAWPYRELERKDFDEVVKMLAEGYNTRRGLRSAYLHRDSIHHKLRARRGARMTALTCGGAIPDNAEYRVILEPSGEFIGTVDEDFAIESMAGDVFQLGNSSWRVIRLEGGSMKVEDAQGLPPSIPFWFGEAPGRTWELSQAVSRLRLDIADHVGRASARLGAADGAGALDQSSRWLVGTLGVSELAVRQAVVYIAAAYATLGAMPSLDTVVFERFFDESGGMQFIIHAPFGSRINRAWGLALRKRFCRGFNFELQAAATENAVILSLSSSHSFPLEEVARYLNSKTVKDLLVQALLAAPMFNVRWRWNAVCSLALKRFQGGRKTPPYLIRMQAEDLVASVFPDQIACFENIVGDREIPDHPLVFQTIKDCLTEAMDIDRLIAIIEGLESGRIRVVARDLVEPSPLAAEIVNSRVYSFLDGAPLEARRTRAVASRRWLDSASADDLGRLDQAAIERVRNEAAPEITGAEELHDALNVCGFLRHPQETAPVWTDWFKTLAAEGRAAALTPTLWVAGERLPQFRALHSDWQPEPAIELPPALEAQIWERESALVEILRGRLSFCGPVEASALATQLQLPDREIEAALIGLQTEGLAMQGRFTPNLGRTEWCDRRLLARIHRLTIDRLRQEIEPVPSAQFLRFLFRWQGVMPDHRGEGPESLVKVLEQLEGYEAAAVSWEKDILPGRLNGYDPAWLDNLCLSGRYVWTRLSPAAAQIPVKATPIALVPRRHAGWWRTGSTADAEPALSGAAERVRATLQQQGASFFEELTDRAGLLRTQAEAALGELVARGLAHSDSFRGLRSLLVPEEKKRRYRGISPYAVAEAGRWTLLAPLPSTDDRPPRLEHIAKVLLGRYGVVFRALLERETTLPAWQELLPVLRRMEARGELRGGRFVSGQYGEQFALPEAVDRLRKVAKQTGPDEICTVSAADPLNLVGIITPGSKLPALPGNRILFRNGIPTAVLTGRETRFIDPVDERDAGALKSLLIRHSAPPQLRAYL